MRDVTENNSKNRNISEFLIKEYLIVSVRSSDTTSECKYYKQVYGIAEFSIKASRKNVKQNSLLSDSNSMINISA